FHVDRGRPNLSIFPRTARFVCFRCDARGDAISFVQQIEGLTFRQAVERLGGVPHREPTLAPRSRRRPSPRAPVQFERSGAELEVLAAAVELYRNRLLVHEHALTYLRDRGIQRETIESAHLGFAAGDELVRYLGWRRLPVASAMCCGLLTRKAE